MSARGARPVSTGYLPKGGARAGVEQNARHRQQFAAVESLTLPDAGAVDAAGRSDARQRGGRPDVAAVLVRVGAAAGPLALLLELVRR